MIENLKLIKKNSYTPLSKFNVACILICKNNQEFVDKNYPELKMEAIKNYDIIKTYLGDKKWWKNY